WDSRGAVFGAAYGLEVVNYFALPGEPRYETPSFRRSNAWEAVRQEVFAVRESVGINEIHNFSKFRVTGPRARDWLDRVMAGRIPAPGRLSLSPMLAPSGRLVGDFTVACLSEEDFRLNASYGSQHFHLRWFEQHLEDGVRIENLSDELTGFQVAGPHARDVLAKVTRADVSNDALPFLAVQRMTVGMADCVVQRVSYTGDLGFEIYCAPTSQRHLWEVLSAAGDEFGMRPFGMRAMMSLRLDRFFGSWQREYSQDYTAAETGLDRFIAFAKRANFIGRAAAEKERAEGPARRLCVFEVATEDADVVAWEPVWADGDVIGYCTSGGFAHWSGKSIAMALIDAKRADALAEAEIEILGERRGARRMERPVFDPSGARMRGG
ncbi:MAG: aminomethyltransferase family protein, partial [Silicimonas sp.]|nr:aminomethyltransferase family protein [Silicimonas sp.]